MTYNPELIHHRTSDYAGQSRMSVRINIPEELYDQARAIAETQNIAVADVFASAFVHHFAAWQRLQERARSGDREKFLALLERVPDLEPADYDRLDLAGRGH